MIAYVPQSVPWDPRQPQGRAVALRPDEVRATLDMLRRLKRARAGGYRSTGYTLTADPEWLVDMAINRRAGWPDDPSGMRGSCMPVGGRFPKMAEGEIESGLRRLAWDLARRIYTRERSVRWLPRRVTARIAHRLQEE